MSKEDSKKSRPLSPHLQVYKPQITSVLSITHRFSEIILFFALPVLAAILGVAAFWEGCFDCFIKMAGSLIGRIILFGLTYALFYNILHGIRHIFWDYGKGFEMKTVRITAWLIILGALALTIGIWCIAYYGI